MTISIESAPTAQELMLALERLGWNNTSVVPHLLSAWTAADSNDSVVIPLDSSKGDFTELLTRALTTLREHHGAAIERALQDVLRGTREIFDVSRFLRDTSSKDGIISWLDGKALLLAAEQSLAAAARSTRSPRRYHGNASSYISNNVLQSAYMGQTEVGSFVVTLLTQPNETFAARKADEPKSGQEMAIAAGAVSGRQVLETLESALDGTRTVLNEFRRIPKLDPFSELVSVGVSSELLRALSTISQDVRRSAVMLDFSQGGSSPRRKEVEFTAEESPILERASRRLLEDVEPIDVVVTGDVTGVSRANVRSDGVARIRVKSGADAGSVRVRITGEAYAQIVEAHRDGLSVEIAGRLERDGKYSWMYSPARIAVLEGPETAPGDTYVVDMFDDDDDVE